MPQTLPTPPATAAPARTPPRSGARRHPVHAAALQAQTRLATPLGTLTAAATANGLAGLWFDDQAHHPGALAAPDDAGQPWLAAARAALAAYFSHRLDDAALHALRLDLHGTPFQLAVWRQLQTIAPGCTRGYGEIAQALGRPTAARAVGAAVGRNPVSLLLPCHRVLGAGGALTGYAGGLARKQALLAHEGR